MLLDWTRFKSGIYDRTFESPCGEGVVSLYETATGWVWATSVRLQEGSNALCQGSAKEFPEAEQQIEAFLDEHGFQWAEPYQRIPVIFDVDR